MGVSLIKESLEKCINFLIEYEPFEKWVTLYFDEKYREPDMFMKLAQIIVESSIIPRICEARKVKLREYLGYKGDSLKKIKNGKCEASTIQTELEKKSKYIEFSFSEGIKRFLDVFDEEFENIDPLIKELGRSRRKKVNHSDSFVDCSFKNYRFKAINVVDDYSVLYFTFWFFDQYCTEEQDELKQISMAKTLAEKAYRMLNNPDCDRKIHISRESLMNYCKFILGKEVARWMFYKIFINYIQSLYYSITLCEEERYEIFKRFGVDIIFINVLLNHMKEPKVSKPQETIVKKQKIYKAIDNKLYNIHRFNEFSDENFLVDIKNLKKMICHLLKDYPNLPQITENEATQTCQQANIIIQKYNNHTDKNINRIFNEILSEYKKTTFFINGMNINILELIENWALVPEKHNYKLLSGNIFNIYTLLICSMMKIKAGNEHERAKKMLEANNLQLDVLSTIFKYTKENIRLNLKSDYTDKIFNFLGYIELDSLDIPILTLDLNSENINIKIQSLAVYIQYE